MTTGSPEHHKSIHGRLEKSGAKNTKVMTNVICSKYLNSTF